MPGLQHDVSYTLSYRQKEKRKRLDQKSTQAEMTIMRTIRQETMMSLMTSYSHHHTQLYEQFISQIDIWLSSIVVILPFHYANFLGNMDHLCT